MQLGTVYSADDIARPGAEPVPGYCLRHRLGRGTLGEVWKVEAAGGFPVAMKFVRLPAHREDALEMRALRIARSIRHPNLLVNFGAWAVDGYMILGMELADRSLWDLYRESRAAGMPGIPREELLGYLADAARGLDHLNDLTHQVEGRSIAGIPHRKVKPQNILLFGGSVKVADFGLARLRTQSVACQTGPYTFAYAAPEFFRKTVTRQSDQYSLAVTYCHMRGGRLPFVGSAGEVLAGHLLGVPDLSMLPEAERLAVARALAKEPGDRWPTCREFIAAVKASTPHAEATEPPHSAVPSIMDLRNDPISATAMAAAFEYPVALDPAVRSERAASLRLLGRSPAVSASILFLAAMGLFLGVARFPKREPARRHWVSASGLRWASPAPERTRSVATRARSRPVRPIEPTARTANVASGAPGLIDRALHSELPTLPEDLFAPLSDPPDTLASAEASAAAAPEITSSRPLYTVRLETRRRPAFALSLPERIVIEPGTSAWLKITLRRQGVRGAVSIRFEQVPDGVSVEPTTIAAGSSYTEVSLAAGANAQPCLRTVRVAGVADGIEAGASLQVEVKLDLALVHFRRGQDRLAADDNARAIVESSQALQLKPNNPVAYGSRATAYHRIGRLKQAIADYSQALRIDRAGVACFNNRGLAYRELGRYDKAIGDYSEAIRLKPADAIVRFNRGMAYLYAGDHLSAIADFTEAIRLRPQYAEAYQGRGDAHARRGESAEALADRNATRRLARQPSAAERGSSAPAGGG